MKPTEARIVAYAVWFATERIETFDKDIAICLRADERNRHAYMPALISCTGMIELFACLLYGDLEAKGIGRLVEFANRFMNPEHYSETALKVLWDVFRHKVAHVSRPYGVQHVAVLNADGKQGLVTWEVTAFDREEPYHQIVDQRGALGAILTNAASISQQWPAILEMRFQVQKVIYKECVKNPNYKKTLRNAWISALRNQVKPKARITICYSGRVNARC